MKLTGSHVVGLLILVGLGIYFFSKQKVSGVVTADYEGAIISPTIGYDGAAATTPAREGFTSANTPIGDSVSFGTELQKS
jgi:hypothetical protein